MSDQAAEAMAAVSAKLEELAGLVEHAVELDARARVARHAAGDFTVHRDVRELLTELLHGRLTALRPYVPYVTPPSGAEEAEATS